MSYTPTQWNTGDTITASALNKIEQGIANAGGGGGACIRLSASAGFASASKIFCYFVYAYQENGNWIVSTDDSASWGTAYGFATPNDRLVVMPLPADDNVGLFLVDLMDADRVISGDISTTPTNVYLSFGSVVGVANGAYRITGNGSYQFVAT